MGPRVTIGVPAYNAERYLDLSLRSLTAQTYEDICILVCDNASTDATEEIARAHAAADRRVRYVRNATNIGAARNHVRCVELADTPYFRWAAADDLSAPTFVERCVEVLDARPDVVQAYPKSVLIDDDGAEIGPYEDGMHVLDESPVDRYLHVLDHLRLVNCLYGVLRLDVLRRTEIHGSYRGADVVVQGEIALHGKIWEVPERLMFRRMHVGAHSAMSEGEQLQHYNPSGRARVDMEYWRFPVVRLRAVRRAPLTLAERARLSWILTRRTISHRGMLWRELVAAARAIVGAR